MYSDEDAAALYDVLNPWGRSDEFYLDVVMDADAVVDIGCGTGVLLHGARERGHPGRLCGVDPDGAALARAKRRVDFEWVQCRAAEMPWEAAFKLATMTGHAFQSLVTDDEIRRSLAAIRRVLAVSGRFTFETRNPLAREWEGWHRGAAIEVVDPSGRSVRVSYNVESVIGEVVTLTETTADVDGSVLRVDRASLRFVPVDALVVFLEEAGFTVEEQFGGWGREPFTTRSAEMITTAVAR